MSVFYGILDHRDCFSVDLDKLVGRPMVEVVVLRLHQRLRHQDRGRFSGPEIAATLRRRQRRQNLPDVAVAVSPIRRHDASVFGPIGQRQVAHLRREAVGAALRANVAGHDVGAVQLDVVAGASREDVDYGVLEASRVAMSLSRVARRRGEQHRRRR